MAIIALVVFGIATPSIATVALIGAVPMTLAVLLVAVFGVETRQRRLEDISGSMSFPPPHARTGASEVHATGSLP